MSLRPFNDGELEAICGVLADTASGLTGSQIGRLLAQVGIEDSQFSTKRHRLFDALSTRQARDRSGNNVGAFIEAALAPVRWVGHVEAWTQIRRDLNAVLAFAGVEVGTEGRLRAIPALKEMPQARGAEQSQRRDEAISEQGDGTQGRAESRSAELARLRSEFLGLSQSSDRQGAGLALERLLNDLFELFDLEPRGSFRVVGEQIDGSFILDREVFLLEAKWTNTPVGEADLLVFRGKIEGKSEFTRGLFVAVNGYSSPAAEALAFGKRPRFVMIDGGHLYRVLDGAWAFDELLRVVWRLLAEEGSAYVPVHMLVERGTRGAR